MFKFSVSFATEVEKNRPLHGCFNRGLRSTKDSKRATGHLSSPTNNVRDLKSLLLSWKTCILVHLSNDPGKKESNFYCCGAIRFPHIEMFSFLRRECTNLQKGCLRKKIYLNSTFKGCIFVLKHFDQSQELQTMAKKMFTI